ncbi:hypothetical protein [Desulfurispora thermophila]|uniref:hypothetical protein n=1 Tax=Desulfurispora thermophila TaxID=265470 RepID=UPI00036E2222|nr:hypothetical protein [Desulfurispora thermophila]
MDLSIAPLFTSDQTFPSAASPAALFIVSVTHSLPGAGMQQQPFFRASFVFRKFALRRKTSLPGGVQSKPLAFVFFTFFNSLAGKGRYCK